MASSEDGGHVPNNYSNMVEELRDAFEEGTTRSLSFRLQQLNAIHKLVEDNFDKMLEAGRKDFRKAKMEVALYELELLKNEIKTAIRELKAWVQREKMPFNWLLPFDNAFVKHDPFGVVLIIGAWNYPFLLALQPLIGAIAAGNCAVIKPSEHSSHSAELMAEMIPKYLDNSCYKVVLGAAPETIELLDNKFDYIFATSSTKIGKCIMQAAAKQLTPITLELGGKSPVYIDDDCDVEVTAKRLIWGKCINLGQTCIAPDYVLCSKSMEKKLVTEIKSALHEWYGNNPENSPDLPRIINKMHFVRIKTLLDNTKGTIAFGGETNENDLYIAPTVVVNVKEDDSLMSEEIFGPILPILTVNSKEEASRVIKSRPKPLALYLFSRNQKTLDYFIERTSSGAICCNDVIVQNGWEGLPFGGVGDSGMGRYHGKFSYETFVHKKSVLQRSFSRVGEKIYRLRYPPYNSRNMKIITNFMKYLHLFEMKGRSAAFVATFVAGAVTSVAMTVGWLKALKNRPE